MHKYLFPRVNETSAAAQCFFFSFSLLVFALVLGLKGEWLYWNHTTEQGAHITKVPFAL